MEEVACASGAIPRVRWCGSAPGSTRARRRECANACTRRSSPAPSDLILDLSELEMIDATGLGVLVGTHRLALDIDRRVVLRAVPPRIMRILAVTRLNRVLHVEAHTAAVA
ncbi:STAS domain-containing protein [Nonomuraea ferruginea]